MTCTPSELHEHAAELVRHAHSLARMPGEQLATALQRAARRLAEGTDALGSELRRALRADTGLSAEMIEWGLLTTLGTVEAASLHLLAAAREPLHARVPSPARLCAVVLAGNVFSAAVRALCVPLCSGVPVLAKTASGDAALPRCFARALQDADAEVARHLRVVAFGRDDAAHLAALLARAEVVSVYGDDASVQAITAGAPATATVVAHGHGLSALYVAAESLRTAAQLHDVAQRVAVDVAAYDQRGCLSPHFVLVEPGGVAGARELARVVAEHGLPSLARLLPAGDLRLADQAACVGFRAVAAVRGELWEGDHHAVSYEARQPLRPSPGSRHVGFYDCEGPLALAQALVPFSAHLKCVGVAGSRKTRRQVGEALAARSAPRVCRAGEMQTPPLLAYADGLPPAHGLFRYATCA